MTHAGHIPMATSTPAGGLVVHKGTALAFFAYDLALAIDLDAAERSLRAVEPGAEQREEIRRTQKGPSYFQFRPRPLRVTRHAPPIAIAGFATGPTVDAVLYDFGAVSIAYAIPLDGACLGDGDGERSLLALSASLYDNRALLDDSRARVRDLMGLIAPALTRPALSTLVEDHVVYQVVAHSCGEDPAGFVDGARETIARLLRAERAPLSRQEVDDAMACRISYAPSDACVIDWNASMVVDDEPWDATAAIEFANVELLEMRHLDDRLDEALEGAHAGLQRPTARTPWPGARAEVATLRRISEMQMESAILFEGVNNALKLVGDQYLARVYRLAAQRFHLPDWDASILRKIATLESIYAKASDRRANRRMESLEWIIILLIAFEIVMSLWPKIVG